MNEFAGSQATFVLFVAGDSPNSRAAITNLHRALGQADGAARQIDIIDVFEQPDVAAEASVVVTPTLLRRAEPQIRMLGDLSSSGQLRDFLEIG